MYILTKNITDLTEEIEQLHKQFIEDNTNTKHITFIKLTSKCNELEQLIYETYRSSIEKYFEKSDYIYIFRYRGHMFITNNKNNIHPSAQKTNYNFWQSLNIEGEHTRNQST